MKNKRISWSPNHEPTTGTTGPTLGRANQPSGTYPPQGQQSTTTSPFGTGPTMGQPMMAPPSLGTIGQTMGQGGGSNPAIFSPNVTTQQTQQTQPSYQPTGYSRQSLPGPDYSPVAFTSPNSNSNPNLAMAKSPPLSPSNSTGISGPISPPPIHRGSQFTGQYSTPHENTLTTSPSHHVALGGFSDAIPIELETSTVHFSPPMPSKSIYQTVSTSASGVRVASSPSMKFAEPDFSTAYADASFSHVRPPPTNRSGSNIMAPPIQEEYESYGAINVNDFGPPVSNSHDRSTQGSHGGPLQSIIHGSPPLQNNGHGPLLPQSNGQHQNNGHGPLLPQSNGQHQNNGHGLQGNNHGQGNIQMTDFSPPPSTQSNAINLNDFGPPQGNIINLNDFGPPQGTINLNDFGPPQGTIINLNDFGLPSQNTALQQSSLFGSLVDQPVEPVNAISEGLGISGPTLVPFKPKMKVTSPGQSPHIGRLTSGSKSGSKMGSPKVTKAIPSPKVVRDRSLSVAGKSEDEDEDRRDSKMELKMPRLIHLPETPLDSIDDHIKNGFKKLYGTDLEEPSVVLTSGNPESVGGLVELKARRNTFFSSFAWNIKNFPSITKPIVSELVGIKGMAFQIFLYPNGYDEQQGKAVSIFLKVVKNESEKAQGSSWERKLIYFRAFVKKQNQEGEDFECVALQESDETVNKFSEETSGWGFFDLIPLPLPADSLSNTDDVLSIVFEVTCEAAVPSTTMNFERSIDPHRQIPLLDPVTDARYTSEVFGSVLCPFSISAVWKPVDVNGSASSIQQDDSELCVYLQAEPSALESQIGSWNRSVFGASLQILETQTGKVISSQRLSSDTILKASSMRAGWPEALLMSTLVKHVPVDRDAFSSTMVTFKVEVMVDPIHFATVTESGILKSYLASVSNAAAKSKSKVARIQNRLDEQKRGEVELKKEMGIVKARNEALEARLERLQSKCSRLESEAVDRNTMDDEFEALKEQNRVLLHELDEARSHQAAHDRLKLSMAGVKCRLSDIRVKMEFPQASKLVERVEPSLEVLQLKAKISDQEYKLAEVDALYKQQIRTGIDSGLHGNVTSSPEPVRQPIEIVNKAIEDANVECNTAYQGWEEANSAISVMNETTSAVEKASLAADLAVFLCGCDVAFASLCEAGDVLTNELGPTLSPEETESYQSYFDNSKAQLNDTRYRLAHARSCLVDEYQQYQEQAYYDQQEVYIDQSINGGYPENQTFAPGQDQGVDGFQVVTDPGVNVAVDPVSDTSIQPPMVQTPPSNPPPSTTTAPPTIPQATSVPANPMPKDEEKKDSKVVPPPVNGTEAEKITYLTKEVGAIQLKMDKLLAPKEVTMADYEPEFWDTPTGATEEAVRVPGLDVRELSRKIAPEIAKSHSKMYCFIW